MEVAEKGSKEPIVREGAKLTKNLITRLRAAGVKEIPVNAAELVGRAILTELVDPVSKEKILDKNHKLTTPTIDKILAGHVESFKVIYLDAATATPVILDTLEMERTASKEEAMVRSTNVSGPERRPPSRRPGCSSTICSTTPSGMISRRSAGSN